MKKLIGCAILAAAIVTPSAAAAGDLRLSIANGRVTLVAQDVPLKQILDEWSRVGQTTIVGAEKLTGGMVTLELKDVPEGRALETLLRTASGYIAKPRTLASAAGASSYDRIMIMAPSRAPAVTAAPAPFTRAPMPMMNPTVIDDDGEPTNVLPPGAMPMNAMPPPQQFPGQPNPNPMMNVPVPNNGQPQPPLTAPRPGQLPMPQPSMPGNPYQMMQPPPIGPTVPPRGPGGQ
jgi:hypothetical protein